MTHITVYTWCLKFKKKQPLLALTVSKHCLTLLILVDMTMMTSRRRLRSSASHRLEVLPPVPLSTYVTLLTLTHSRNDLKLFCLIVRTDLLLLLYGAPRRFVERRLTNLSLYCIVLYCIVLYFALSSDFE